MKTKKATIKVPKSIMSLPEADRDAILGVLAQAVRLPAVMPIYHNASGEESDIWDSDPESLLGVAEDEFYAEIAGGWAETIHDLFDALGLTMDGLTLKSMEFDLLKAKKKTKLDAQIELNKQKRDTFLKYLQGMNPFSRAQVKKLDNLLKQKLPDYAKVAEKFATRAGFIGKIRNQAEREAFEVMGALVDRYPETIKAAEKEGVVLTLREQRSAASEGRKVKILPLTPLESRSVQYATQHAADKLTEVSERHQAGVRQLILTAQRERWEPQKLAQELYDKYGDHNRDWRRVAITELAFAANDAYLSGLEEGDTVVGMGSDTACKHCKNLVIGKTFTVLKEPPKQETHRTDTEFIWVGKSNYGRKTAEWRGCIPVHVQCRCRFHRVSRFYNVDDSGKFVLKTTAQLIQEERARRGLPPDPNLV